MQKALTLRNEALVRMNIDPKDLDKLNKVPLIVAFVGVLVNLLLLAAISNNAWLEGTALADGQPFQVHLSLGSATFGPSGKESANFCTAGPCSLKELCDKSVPYTTFPNGYPKNTASERWCQAASAGSWVGGLLG